MKLKRRLLKLAFAAAVTYLMDPTLGASRRSKLKADISRWRNQLLNRHDATRDHPTLTIADHNGHVAPAPSEQELVITTA